MGKQKVIFEHFLSPGDVLVMTAAIRDFHKAHGDAFEIMVDTSCRELWDNNPYVSPLDNRDRHAWRIKLNYPLIHQSNQLPYHFIHAFHKEIEDRLNVRVPITAFKGDIHLSEEERMWTNQLSHHLGYDGPFWIMMAGGKYDFTCKWWNPASYQAVVDHFKGKILFAQCGEQSHWHPPLKGVVNLIGKTHLRQFVRLMYHADGVVSPVTFAMHLAAAIPTKPGQPQRKPAVVIAGGREPATWEKYEGHRFFENVGSLPCSQNGGCWISRCQPVGDGDQKDEPENRCKLPVIVGDKLTIPKCMDMIRPDDVIRAIESYYEGGLLSYMTAEQAEQAAYAVSTSEGSKGDR
jgi:ADP-heptose:LPS heptosyltransferase